jgi:acyl dehydratase
MAYASVGGVMSVHQPIARNFATASENKIHSDEIAKRFGFTGALVPGVTVFGHLAYPLTAELGERWLENSWVTTRFLKPAYEGERLTIVDRAQGADRYAVECRNPSGTLLATLECAIETTQPSVDPCAQLVSSETVDRMEISWESVQVGRLFPTYTWIPDVAHNREYAARLDDDTDLFGRGVLHPHAILSQANQALVRRYIMPAWIHTGSEIRFRRLLRVGDVVEVRAVPVEKWEKKGHQFIKLYIAYVVCGVVATEIWHTAIFRVAQS